MKKFLLTVASLATFFSSSAQDARFVIYDGTTADILTGGPASGWNGFSGLLGYVNSDTSHVLLQGNKVWYVEGTVAPIVAPFLGYYVGGTANANYQATGDPTLFGINLTNVNAATFSFSYITDVAANVTFDFHSEVGAKDSVVARGTFAIRPNFGITTVDTNLTTFTHVDGSPLNAADWATVNKIVIQYSLLTPMGTIKAALDDISITDGPTAISDKVMEDFKDEEVTVYSISGAVVAQGKIDGFNLSPGFYILNSASKTQKVLVR